MLEIALGSAMMYYFATEAFDIKKKPAEAVYYTEVLDSRNASFTRMHHEPVLINPAVEDQFRGIVRQAYDYSCGSAALTTLINGYVGAQLTEQQTMDGLLRYGEYERIIERRSFSLLDMKRFVTALGLESGGYKGEFEDLVKQGVIYTDIETALHEHEEIVKKYWMTLIPPTDHKWAALHGAVWSGGSFVYVPAGVQVDIPLQSYFRLNAPGAGQFEHTMIIVEEGAKVHFIEGCSAPKYDVSNLHAGAVELFVKDNASLRYSTIENWSKNMYNLNTKRCIVGKGGTIEWVSGSFGSRVSCLYPMSILNGEGAHCEFTGVTFAGEGQFLDTGCKVVHNAPHTTSNVIQNARPLPVIEDSMSVNPPFFN